MRLFGPPNIEQLKTKRDVKGLLKALRHPKDAWVRRDAALSLGEIGDVQDVEALLAALGDRDSWVRSAAAEALGAIGDKRAVEPLVAGLKDGDSKARIAAVQALAKIGVSPVDPLITALGDEKPDVRRTAAEALGAIGDMHAVEPLILALKDADEGVRRNAAETLGKLGDGRAVESLIAALKDRDSVVRLLAAGALHKLGFRPDDDEIGASYWIAQSEFGRCIQIGPAAVQPLIAVLRDQDLMVRSAAAQALQDIGGSAVDPLILTLKDPNEGVRWVAAEALGEIGDMRAVRSLLAALGDRYGPVRSLAAQALDKLGFRPENNEEGAYYWIAKGEVGQCVRIGPAAVVPLIAALEKGKGSWKIRKAAAEALVRIYKSGTLPESFRKLILGQRPAITVEHFDTHDDYVPECGIGRWSAWAYSNHTDRGIGVDFPL